MAKGERRRRHRHGRNGGKASPAVIPIVIIAIFWMGTLIIWILGIFYYYLCIMTKHQFLDPLATSF